MARQRQISELAQAKAQLTTERETLSEALINSKTIVDPQQWLAAALDGSRKAMHYIVDHCVQDVLVLEKVIGALKAYSGTYSTYGSGF